MLGHLAAQVDAVGVVGLRHHVRERQLDAVLVEELGPGHRLPACLRHHQGGAREIDHHSVRAIGMHRVEQSSAATKLRLDRDDARVPDDEHLAMHAQVPLRRIHHSSYRATIIIATAVSTSSSDTPSATRHRPGPTAWIKFCSAAARAYSSRSSRPAGSMMSIRTILRGARGSSKRI